MVNRSAPTASVAPILIYEDVAEATGPSAGGSTPSRILPVTGGPSHNTLPT